MNDLPGALFRTAALQLGFLAHVRLVGAAPRRTPTALDIGRSYRNMRSQCPDSEVRIILWHARLRTSESKGTSNSMILAPL